MSRRVLWPAIAVFLALSSLTAQAQDDDGIPGESYHWQAQLRGLYVSPLNEHRPLGVDLSSAVAGELAGEWLFMPRWSTEIALASPANLDLRGVPGTVRLLTQTWTVKYYFPSVAVGSLIPYVGTGIYHSTASRVGTTAGIDVGNPGFGWVLQAGFTYALAQNVFVSADVRYLDNLEPELLVDGSNSGHIGIDPIVAGVGIGLRF
jgi:outer membrane protein W